MKEEKFIKEVEKLSLNYLDTLGMEIPIYYSLNAENIVLDEESMKEEFEHKLKQIMEILK